MFIETITDAFNLTSKNEFLNVKGYRGFRTKYQPKTYDVIQANDYRYIMQHVDGALEKKIGYDIVYPHDGDAIVSPGPDHV